MFRLIKKGSTSVKVSRLGAELKSMNVGGEELIWQPDTSIWAGSAPILFPFVGRLKGKEYYYAGKRYKMPIHGFARRCFFDVEDVQESSVKMSLKDDDETIMIYPFNFKLEVVFTVVNERKLNIDYTVLNYGSKEMFFSLGSHPGYTLPPNNSSLDNYYIEFDQSETLIPYKLVNNEYLVKQDRPYLSDEKIIRLHDHIFDEDALIFTGVKSRYIYLKNDKTGRVIKMFIDKATDLGIWAKPGAPYVCVEPWFGHDDLESASGKIEEKQGIIRLGAGREFTTGYSIELL